MSDGNQDRGPGELHRDRAAAFVVRFDRGEFWLAHEELEELWQEDKIDAYKGLIQVAAGCLHMERDNGGGAERMFRTAADYLEAYPDRFRRFDLVAIRRHLDRLRRLAEGLARGESPPPDAVPGFRMAEHYAGELDPDAVEEVELPYRVRRHLDDDPEGRGESGDRG